ncbi:PaaI family thioesterase [Reyranella sp. CPCC 100927]|uniref:PaaI family thioesterase n=1 Tax=Reyranella sp. CPCC 100927 TaxID=2599616 RepID=UPI0011B46409|nr:PaaI family thioesterase [Reyranella sp. CPCC 100927]TWT04047.1 PaaI family thioesterase [Reyranella sp. CPCC 100927]
MTAVPEGFRPFSYSSAFLDAVGPLYEGRAADGTLVLGLRIEERHCNRRGFAHGGLLMTLADLVLGYSLISVTGRRGGVTVNLTTDFAGAVQVGQWVEARADVQKATGALAFANCYLTVEGKRIVRASAIFKTPPQSSVSAPHVADAPAPSAVPGG